MSERVDEKMGGAHSRTNSSTHQPMHSPTHPPTNPSTHSPSSEVAIKVEHLSKKYCKSLKRSMLYGVQDISRNMIGLGSHPDRLRKKEFWAVNDVSFEVRKGETLGIIGPNGAGKTTLLKMLNGIFWPDKGKITVRGRVGALIEVGAGFHPLLTGRENIYINAAILGMSKKEVDKKFNDIVQFAEIGDFIDSPVKFYSSGMFVRLGFSVAVHCQPDILLVDEIIAIGDVGFRAKCYNVIADLMNSTAVILVSHSIPVIARYATKIMVMNRGQMFLPDRKVEGIRYYYNIYSDNVGHHLMESHQNHLIDFKFVDEMNNETNALAYGGKVYIKLRAQVLDETEPVCHLAFLSQEQTIVATVRSNHGDLFCHNGKLETTLEIDPFLLSPGLYKISILILDRFRQKHLIWHDAAFSLQVTGEHGDYGPTAVQLPVKFKRI